MTLLTGCARQLSPQVEYQQVKVAKLPIPAELTSPIIPPQISDGMTYGDSVALNAELLGLLGQCNIDRAAIRKIEQPSK
ncbi:Rz1-like lysis system protein LysC [Jejubacter sp. L23]|uniref:Rz1-like lysis system protein LysC n=1 Tax=Jejubacter sp. L23 TaxID=3092086 RepID=UPI003D75023F